VKNIFRIAVGGNCIADAMSPTSDLLPALPPIPATGFRQSGLRLDADFFAKKPVKNN
jgi:hypothetical protein